MRYYKTDITKVLEGYKAGEYTLELAVQMACVAFEKESDRPEEATIEERKQAFLDRIKQFEGNYNSEQLTKFYTYWTSFKTPQSKLMHFEKQKTFNMGMRLATWVSNANKFLQNQAKAKVINRNKGAR